MLPSAWGGWLVLIQSARSLQSAIQSVTVQSALLRLPILQWLQLAEDHVVCLAGQLVCDDGLGAAQGDLLDDIHQLLQPLLTLWGVGWGDSTTVRHQVVWTPFFVVNMNLPHVALSALHACVLVGVRKVCV